MKWKFNEPRLGDMIRVKLGDLYHYGIFASDSEVLQFGLAPSARAIPEEDVEVCISDIDTFLAGGFLEVCVLDKKEQKKRISPERSVQIARGRLGERGYNILFNNCEHFAYECIFGVKYSSQTEAFRERFRALPTLDVYVAQIPEEFKYTSLYPKERDKEVRAVKNDEVRRHKYYAWRLLEYALMHTFGYDIKHLKLNKAPCGKWVCPDCEISISHSGNIVAVALSRNPVGVDVQLHKALLSERFSERMLTENERTSLFETVDKDEYAQRALLLWAKKESIFKTLNSDKYIPAEIETSDYNTYTEIFDLNGERYYLSVAGADVSNIKVLKNINL